MGAEIVARWPVAFRALYGGTWPTTYCAIDTETTGFSFDKDVVTEWGHCLVEGGVVVDRLSLVIDWTNHPVVLDGWLRDRLRGLKNSMESSGRSCHMTYDRMRSEGKRPETALVFIKDFVRTLKSRGVLFVAHGGAFDERMILHNLVGFGVDTAPALRAGSRETGTSVFTFGDNGLLDTEGIEKASQAVDHLRLTPRPGDTLRSYFHRVRYTRLAGVRSSLEHCFDRYNLAEHLGRDELHGARADAYCVHLLMERFRDAQRDGVAVASPGGPVFCVAPSPSALLGTTTQFIPSERRRVRGQRRS